LIGHDEAGGLDFLAVVSDTDAASLSTTILARRSLLGRLARACYRKKKPKIDFFAGVPFCD
jgi:hypothetical protein